MTEWEDDVTIFGIVTIGIVTIVTKSGKKKFTARQTHRISELEWLAPGTQMLQQTSAVSPLLSSAGRSSNIDI